MATVTPSAVGILFVVQGSGGREELYGIEVVMEGAVLLPSTMGVFENVPPVHHESSCSKGLGLSLFSTWCWGCTEEECEAPFQRRSCEGEAEGVARVPQATASFGTSEETKGEKQDEKGEEEQGMVVVVVPALGTRSAKSEAQ